MESTDNWHKSSRSNDFDRDCVEVGVHKVVEFALGGGFALFVFAVLFKFVQHGLQYGFFG